MIVLSEDRNREDNYRSDPHHPGRRTRTIWNRTRMLANNVYVYESSLGESRVVKRVSRKDSRLTDSYASELDVLRQVSNDVELQEKQLFVHFHGWFSSSEHVCLMMEYCRFGDISKCYPDPLSEVEARRICEKLLDGLVVLHGLGITHRDIKPQNVLVVQKNPIRVKIADFGISKRALEGQTELRTQIGTQGYMAPEILGLVDEAKLDSTYSSAVDIWSLGCLLYYLLTKETPFSEYEALRDYAKGYTEFPDGPLIEKGVGSSARAFIKALLAPAPESRPEASADLMADWVVGHDTGPTDTALMPAESPRETQDAKVDSVPRSPVEPQEDTTSPIASDVEEEDEMDFYSYELWHIVKSTKTKTGSAERLIPILDQGANPSILHDGSNALHLAAEHGSPEWVEILLTYAASVKITTRPRSETALHLATCQGDLDLFLRKLRSLYDYGVNLDAQNLDGDTALHLAIARLGSVDSIRALLDAGASTERKGREGRTPLLYAIHLRREDKAGVLLDGGAAVDYADENGRTPLHLAIAKKRIRPALIRRIIDAGPDINQPDRDGRTPLFDAVKLDRPRVAKLLLEHGADRELGIRRVRYGWDRS
ncbi:STYKc [Aspergillus sp. HF37]|nr:STYKc [Aspergillus sp. HF37]